MKEHVKAEASQAQQQKTCALTQDAMRHYRQIKRIWLIDLIKEKSLMYKETHQSLTECWQILDVIERCCEQNNRRLSRWQWLHSPREEGKKKNSCKKRNHKRKNSQRRIHERERSQKWSQWQAIKEQVNIYLVWYASFLFSLISSGTHPSNKLRGNCTWI